MLTNVLTIVASVLTVFTVPTFDYLKYRTYTRTVRHIVDKLGTDGLKTLSNVTPPSNFLHRSTPGRRTSCRCGQPTAHNVRRRRGPTRR